MQSSARAVRLEMLSLLAAVGGSFHLAQLQLIKAPFTPGPNLVPGDLTEADFDGYAAATALAYGSPFVAGDGSYRITPGSKSFVATGGTTPNIIYGYAVLNTGGTAVQYAELFADPVPINVADDGLVVDPEYVWGN